MVVNANFNDSGLENCNVKTVEKVHYLGDLRIVGQVMNNMSDKDPIGYVVMTEKTQKFKMYTVNQTISLLNKFKFVNAELKDGKIVNTECAMSRIPKYSTNMRVIGNPGVIILGEIIDKDKLIGYRALDTNGRIADLVENELITLNNNGIDIINAKIVTKNSKSYVSAIKGEFTKIEKSHIKNLKHTESKEFAWRKQMHVNKWLNYLGLRIMRYTFIGEGSIINDNILARYPEREQIYGGGYLDLNREATILAKEVYTSKNGVILSKEDVELFKKIVKEVPHLQQLGYNKQGRYVSPNESDKFFIALIAQFILNSKTHQDKLVEQVYSKGIRNSSFIKKVLESGYACKSFKETYNRIRMAEYNYNKKQEDNYVTEEHKKKMFKTKTFVTAKDIAQLGFAISESNRGYKFNTDTNSCKTLLYLGDIIGDDYSEYTKLSRCLGDLASIAYVEKLINNFYDYNLSGDEIRAAIEMIIAVSYIFNSEAMKRYTEKNIERLLDVNISIPDYDEVSGIDYKLPSEIKMYYASGFNVFLNDNDYVKKPYFHKHLRFAELLNYRQLGISHNIEHPMLKSELSPIVNMITSDNCDAELVDKMVGQLRFL